MAQPKVKRVPSPAPKSRRLWPQVGLMAAIASLSAIATAGLVYALPLSRSAKPVAPTSPLMALLPYSFNRPVNVLVMGLDQAETNEAAEKFGTRSDTLLVLRFDPLEGTTSLLSIPRDTQVAIPGYGTTKVNAANVFGGPALAADVVSRTLNDIPIDRYLRIDTTAFKELVDLVGGIEVYVPKPMRYTDNTQKLYIDLPAGRQTLNGDQAEQFARFRYDELGDIGRVQRQQMLLRALRQKLANPLILTKAPDLVKVLQKYVDTNLSFEEIMALVSIGLQQDLSQMRMVMLPGRPIMQDEISYWRLDEGARDRLVSDFFGQQSFQPIDRLAFEDLRVAIQDSSGQPQAAQALAEALAKLGIRRVYVIEDWPESLEKTQIIAQRGDLNQAEALKQQLNLGEVLASSDGDIGSDLTIRIGRDWQPTTSLKP
ncbi:LCP family protein [Synechococcus elongatus IITB4]|uniref:LCP family protein n=1 Tax=Synechococcus elongatus TaxID=32046 RepID=UPI0030CECBA9